METQFSKQQILINLGLTLKQARVYLTLAKNGPSRTKDIADFSKVARSDVYSTLEKLQQLGLVEKIIRNPLYYKALPIKQGLTLLLERRTEQFESLKANAETLLSTIEYETPDDASQTGSPQFILVPKGSAFIDRLRTSIEKAQQSIDLVVSWKRFSRGIVDALEESIGNAWARNVKMRFIVEKPPKSKTSEQLVQFCLAKPSFHIRFLPKHPETIFGIYDKRELFVVVVSKTDLQDSPALWSNSISLVSLASDYFELLWQNATQNMC